MAGLRAQNWFGNITSSPRVIVYPRRVEEIVSILRDVERYPSPVRAVGSNHSTTLCGTADGGTLLVMRNMNRILHIGPDSVTAEAGALYIDVSHELQRHGLQFNVNVEIGNLTIGSAACGGTKDASMPGELGQVCSYATAIKMVTPSGDLVEINEEQPELLQVARSSYGLFGVIYEVTFKARPLQSMAVYHKTYSLEKFGRQLPALKARGESIMMYLNPFLDTVTVEFRRYRNDLDPRRANRWQWRLRNYVWKTLAPSYSHAVSKYLPIRAIRDFLINRFYCLIDMILVRIIKGDNTLASDQTIRYPEISTNSRYTFSIWAFPEETYIRALADYYKFCRSYYQSKNFRCNMSNVGYRIARDTGSLFSYSFHHPVMTFDPVSTGTPGWEEFLTAYNEFASEHNGVPLFNQSHLLTREQVTRAFGDRLAMFETYRHRFDPAERLLNDYFREFLRNLEKDALSQK
jgi:FAD/FMN-containing dehydrogenase